MSVISFIVESLICSGLFLVLYRWMLAKKVGFRICRAYLIVTMVLSVTIPIMDVPLYPSENVVRLSEWTVFSFDDFGAVPADLEEAVAVNHNSEAIKPESSAQITDKSIDLKLILTILYTLVGAISLALLAYNTARIYRLRSKSKLTYEEDYTLAEHEDIKTPFSFIRTIFMGFNYEPQERRQILTHEASHVRHRHSYERLLMSVLRSIFWFNPFFWMAEKDLEEVQEWEADKDVLDEGWSLKTYRTTIFKQLFGYNPDITCGLNHSLTKQRFIMMTQSHRGKGAWLRLAATLPVIALVFLAFGCGVKSQEEAVETTNLTLDEQEPLTFRIHVAKSNEEKGTYSIYCNDNLTDIETISKTVSEYFSGEEMYNTTVSISADENVPMGIITDIKEQLRNARALKVRYETDDSAIEKRMPPAVENTEQKSDEPRFMTPEEWATDVSRRNLISFKINAKDKVLLATDRSFRAQGHYICDASEFDVEILKNHILNPENKATLPEYEMRDITMPDGSTKQFKVSNAIVSLQIDRGTSYEGYTKAMECITTAYKELREELSAEVFGKTLAELSDAEMQVIYQAVPMNVSETEPKDIRR
ncbi:MAG: M48 family metalloprotease [Bacteroidales bacterium]|nr:M48 family metalloprotease [Bacteroidales bacterium]